MPDRATLARAAAPVALGAIVRVWAWFRWTAWAGSGALVLDPAFHWGWAKELVAGVSTGDAWMVAPGPAFLFAAGQWAFGEKLTAAVGIALALDLAVVEVIRRLGARFSPTIGLTAGLAAAVAPAFVFHAVTLLGVAPAMLTLGAALLLAIGAADDAGWRGAARLGAAGALLVVGAWFRPNLLLLPPVLILAGGWAADAPWPTVRGLVRAAVAVSLGFVVGLAPTAVRNHAVSGAWVPISANAGANLAMAQTEGLRGNFPPPLPVPGNLKAMNAYFLDTAGQALGERATVVASDQWWRAEANRRMAADPTGVLLRGVGRFARALSAIEVDDHYDYLGHQSDGTLPWGIDLGHVLPALAIVGFARGGSRRERVVLAVTCVAVAASLAPFLVVERYRIAMDAARYPLAAAGAWALIAELRARRWGWPAVAVSVVVASHLDPFRGVFVVPDVLAGLPGTVARSVHQGTRAADEATNLAAAFERDNARLAAAPFHARAVALDPSRWGDAVGLATSRIAAGDVDGALRDLTAWVDAHPDVEPALLSACGLALQVDRPALDLCGRAVRQFPENAEARYQWGMALWQAGRLDEADAALAAEVRGPYGQRAAAALRGLRRER